uniref:Uncharacterized protein n=1 Tax=Romanomermis culicivorax TaxID=13658 RepID=A0A915K7R1_ROMCU
MSKLRGAIGAVVVKKIADRRIAKIHAIVADFRIQIANFAQSFHRRKIPIIARFASGKSHNVVAGDDLASGVSTIWSAAFFPSSVTAGVIRFRKYSKLLTSLANPMKNRPHWSLPANRP